MAMRRLRPDGSLASIALGAVLVVTLSACTAGASVSSSSPSASTASPSADGSLTTVRGIATAGPVCPVERPGDPGCAPRPVAGAILIVGGKGGSEVARITTGPDGRFALGLPPGDYTLTPQPVGGLLGTARPIRLSVGAPGSPTPAPLKVEYDTGIR